MKQENAQKRNSMKWFAVLGMVVMVLVGIMVTSSGLSWGRLLSQFSGNGVTPATASSKWQPSVGNPNRAKVATYSTRLDAIIVRILARGSALTASGFKSYIANLSDGIVAIGAKPEYADDQDIKDVVAYLTYELNDAKTTLSMGGAFFADITNLVEGTGGNTGVVSGGNVASTGSVSGGTNITCTIPGQSNVNGACTCTNNQVLNSNKTACVTPTLNACDTQITIPLSQDSKPTKLFLLSNGGSQMESFNNATGKSTPTYLNLSFCAKPARSNADYESNGVGYYTQENLIKACPNGYHPVEQSELKHISPENMLKSINQLAVNTYFENGVEKQDTNGSRFWTFDNYWDNTKKYSKGINTGRIQTVEHGLSASNSQTLALPVFCVANHEYSRNSKDKLTTGGCEESVTIEGFNVCTKQSELFKEYPAIIQSTLWPGNYYAVSSDTLVNRVTDRWGTKDATGNYTVMSFPKNARNIVCPTGYDFPSDPVVIEAIRKSSQVARPSEIIFTEQGTGVASPAIVQYKMNNDQVYISQKNGTAKVASMKGGAEFTSILTSLNRSDTNWFSIPTNWQRFGGNLWDGPNNSSSWYMESDFFTPEYLGLICIEQGASYEEAMKNLSGCKTLKQVGSVNFCTETSRIGKCVSGYHALTAQELKANQDTFFQMSTGYYTQMWAVNFPVSNQSGNWKNKFNAVGVKSVFGSPTKTYSLILSYTQWNPNYMDYTFSETEGDIICVKD